MALRSRRMPKPEKLRRKENLRGLQAALAYSDPIVDRNGEVIDRGAQVRVEAIQALVELETGRDAASDSSSEVVLWLSGALVDDSERVGRAAAEGLGRLGTPAAVDELIEFLALRAPAAQPGVREVALDAIAASKRPGLTEQWARKVVERAGPLDEHDHREFAVIAGADGHADPQAALRRILVPRLEPDAPGAAEERPAETLLTWCMPADLAELKPLLARPDVPESAVRVAGHSGDQALLQPLVELLGHDSRTIRREAVAALGALCDTAAVIPLLAATTDPDVIVRRKAVGALDMLGSAGVTAAMALLSNSAGDSELPEAAEQPAVATGDRWLRTLERLAEVTGLSGRGQSRWRANNPEQARRIVGIRTRYDALLSGPEPPESGEGPS